MSLLTSIPAAAEPTVTVVVTAPVAAVVFTPQDLGTMAAALSILADIDTQPTTERANALQLSRKLHGCLQQLAAVQALQATQPQLPQAS